MANNHRVHPMDVEGNSGGPPYAPKYVMLSENGGDPNASIRPPPYRRNIPRYHSTAQPYKKKGNCCLKCICCFYCFLFFFIFGVSAFAFYLYALYEPKAPKYAVERIEIGAFDVQALDFSIYTEFNVIVKAENPNDKISIFYGEDNQVEVCYSDSTLCSGRIQPFHQGHKNTTFIHVVLKGKSEFGSGLQAALMDNQKTGKIPLLIKVRVPVIVELGDVPLKQLTVLVNCSVVINSLTPKKKIDILSTKYNIGLEYN